MADPYKLRKGQRVVIECLNEIIRGEFCAILPPSRNPRRSDEKKERLIIQTAPSNVRYLPIKHCTSIRLEERHARCDCMPEPDPLYPERERVLTHSLTCPQHPLYDDTAASTETHQ